MCIEILRGGVSLLILLASLLFAAGAFAAPDEEALGKAEGYPVCPPSPQWETRCLVGSMSRYDEVFPARKVAAGAKARPLERSESEPAISYTYQSQRSGLADYLARNRTTGLLILKGDTILVERYQYDRKPEQRMVSHSMAKTIVAMLVGVALSDHKIHSLDDRSSGVQFAEGYTGNSGLAMLFRLSALGESAGGAATVMPFRTRDRAPGERFHYSSAETQVLGLVLRAVTGKPLAEYLSEKIWQPMGAEADASWIIDKGGYEVAYIGVNARVRDYARLGMLLANDGALDGRPIIPVGWVREATTPPAAQFEPRQMGSFFGYGYQTWILPGNRRQFVLLGLRGQAVFVDPKSKLVMVHTAAREIGDSGMELIQLWSGVVQSLAIENGQ